MGSKKKSKRMTPEEQSARFIEAAKKAEADESGEEFEKAIKKLIPARNPSRAHRKA